eukprot:156449-Prymnesium_polylepis.1
METASMQLFIPNKLDASGRLRRVHRRHDLLDIARRSARLCPQCRSWSGLLPPARMALWWPIRASYERDRAAERSS